MPLAAFKAARLFSPHKVQEMKPTTSDLESLKIFPFVTIPQLTALKDEYPKYVAATEDVCRDYEPLEFWKNHELTLPTWSKMAQRILLLLPSSASAESVLNNE